MCNFCLQIEASLNDWKDGNFKRRNFSGEEYAERWRHHKDGLDKLKNRAQNWTARLQMELYEQAWYVPKLYFYLCKLKDYCSEHASAAKEHTPGENTDLDLVDFAALEAEMT